MTMLAIDWGFAWLLTGVGIGVTFVLLIVLIWVINLQSELISKTFSSRKKEAPKPAVTTDMHPTPHEQAAIAMAMHLYFDAHDEEPHIINHPRGRETLLSVELEDL